MTTRTCLLSAAALALVGCVDELPGVSGTQSLEVTLISPDQTSSEESPLPDDARELVISVRALDEDKATDTSVDGDVSVYVQFLGSLTPELGARPLATVRLSDGESGEVTLELPPVFGPTTLWVEDRGRDDASFATGTSPTLWFRNPHLADISRPLDEARLDALENSPLEAKQVKVSGSRYGERGRLIVTGVYAQGYTVSDSECADAAGTPPCVTGEYDHVLVFTFSRPRDENGNDLEVGQVIDGFAGAVQEFNGLTEIGFPQTFVADEDPSGDPAMVPAPHVIQADWLSAANLIEMERRESALVAIEGATVCELDDDYDTYKQWKLDLGNGCERGAINVITAGVVEFDPATVVGEVMPRIVGTLRAVNIDSFHVWIVHPRSIDDLE